MTGFIVVIYGPVRCKAEVEQSTFVQKIVGSITSVGYRLRLSVKRFEP